MNRVIIATAGSGKTTHLVERVADLPAARILITTFTNENVANIRERLVERFGCVPSNVTVASWYSVLLTHGVRPYQNQIAEVPMPWAINLINDMPHWVQRTPKANVDRYFFTLRGDMYVDRVSEFVCLLDERTGGLVLDRLAGIFAHIFIDEVQDLAGYDLELLDKLFGSPIDVLAVGDPRQGTYSTNRSSKNKAVARSKIVDWIDLKEAEGRIEVVRHTDSWRSNQVICDFADSLYPHLPPTKSRNDSVTGHDGIFQIPVGEAVAYYNAHAPIVLRHNVLARTLGLPAMNIGVVKGRTFDRVLIFPTGPMKAYLATSDLSKAGDIAKFYVAVTRARYSVAFVI